MRRAPRCEVETVREARRTVRLSAGTVPLTIAERRLLDLLVDTTSGNRSRGRLVVIAKYILCVFCSEG